MIIISSSKGSQRFEPMTSSSQVFLATNWAVGLSFDMVEIILGKGENAGYQYFLLSQKCFQNLSVSKPLTLSQMTKSLQTTFPNLLKTAESSPNRWKTLWKSRNWLLWAIYPFPAMFSKDLYCRHHGLFGQELHFRTERVKN